MAKHQKEDERTIQNTYFLVVSVRILKVRYDTMNKQYRNQVMKNE